MMSKKSWAEDIVQRVILFALFVLFLFLFSS